MKNILQSAIFLMAFVFTLSAQAQIQVKDRLKVLKGGQEHILSKGDKIKALVWNIHKAEDIQWFVDVRELLKNKNVTLFQEAVYGDDVMGLLQELPSFEWSLATSFKLIRKDLAGTGVTTGSKMRSLTQDVLATKITEPIAETPKVSLYNTYPIYTDNKKKNMTDEKHSLLIANVHAINFVTDLSFMIEIFRIEARLKRHKGPIFLGGDFNTWTKTRIKLLSGMAKRLNMTPVEFSENERRITLGHPLDHIYTRGLKFLSKENLNFVTSSDHIPLSVEMELE